MLPSVAMNETRLILSELKSLLKARGITYAEIATNLGVSESTIKRTLTSQKITLERLEEICQAAKVSLFELIGMTKKPDEKTRHLYTMKQERFLSKNPKYLAFFDLLIRNGSLEKVKKIRPHLKQKTIHMYLKKLDELGLIEWHPGDIVKYPIGRDVAWNPDGPLRKTFLKWAKDDFVTDDFKRDLDHFSFTAAELTDVSIQKIQHKLKELNAEVSHLSQIDKNAKGKTQNVAVMLGSRPWRFSILEDC